MKSNNWTQIFYILGQSDINQAKVAAAMGINEGTLSRIKKGAALTKDRFDLFNAAFGHIIKIDPSLINEKARGRKANSTLKYSGPPKGPSDHILNRQELFLLVGQIDEVLKEKQVSAEGKLVKLRGLIKQLKSGI